MTKEKWNQIVEIHNQYLSSQENIVQGLWESIFAEIFGYSRLCGDIDTHRSIRIGSTERVIPDIIIKNGEKDLFVVELKQHNMFYNTGIERQLLSYLKLLRVQIGVLICQKIYVYKYDSNKGDYEQEKIEIDLVKDNPDGIKFLELFHKEKFNNNVISQLVEEKNKLSKKVKEIKDKLTDKLIIDLLKKFFLINYNAAEVDCALNNYNISISEKGEVIRRPSSFDNYHFSEKNEKENKSYSSVLTSPTAIMTKYEAVRICQKNGINISTSYTFASSNSTSNFYWANPKIDLIRQNWTLLLNDKRKKELHVINIPANTIDRKQLVIRSDKPALLDLQIRYNDTLFRDSRSGFLFGKYLVKTIKY